MHSSPELSTFLRDVERRAYKRALFATRDSEAALDLVQEAMIRLCEKYGHREPAEWILLFQRILTNAILDWHRRSKVRAERFSNWSELGTASDEGELPQLLDWLGGEELVPGSDIGAERRQVLEILEQEIAKLPDRQREAFLLRYWEEMDVAETAQVMGCSSGSVKTHCSRAAQTLAKALQARGIQHEPD